MVAGIIDLHTVQMMLRLAIYLILGTTVLVIQSGCCVR